MPERTGPGAETEHLEKEHVVVRVVPEQVQVDEESRAGAARTTGPRLEMPREKRVVERPRVGRDDEIPAPDRMSALELVERHLDAGVVQPIEHPLDPVRVDETRAGVVRDSGATEQREIRTVLVL